MKLESITYRDIKTTLPLIRENALEFLCQLQEQYGDLVKVRLPFFTFFVVSKGVIAKQLLTEQQKNLCRPSYIRNASERYGLGGILVADGEPWKAARKRLGEIFHPKRVKQRSVELEQCISSILQESLITNTAVHPLEMLSKITLSLVFEFAYQYDVRQFDHDIVNVYQELIHQFLSDIVTPIKSPLWLPTKRNLHITPLLKRYRENIGRLASKLSSESGMDERALCKEISDIFTAGMETTANTLTWCIYFLLENPKLQSSLRAELQSNPESRQKTSLKNFILESIRLFPPGYQLNRQIASTFSINGISFRKNQQIIIFPFQIHRDSNYFDDPYTFKPERFTSKMPAVFMPFGFGAHFCIGSQFALTIAEQVLTYLLVNYTMEKAYHSPIKPRANIALTPSENFKVIFTDIMNKSTDSDPV